MPATPGIQKIKLIPVTQASVSQSPFTGSQQTFEWPAEWWEAEVSLPPMRRATAEAWNAFLCGLGGRAGTFYLGDSAGKTLLGAGGSPTYAGGNTGRVFALNGFPSNTLVLKAGDYIQHGAGVAATRLQLSGGSITDKLFLALGTSVNTQVYITTVRIKNIGAKTVRVVSNLGGLVDVAAGAETEVSFQTTGNGSTAVSMNFTTLLAGDTLDFIAWAPRIKRLGFDDNLIPTTNQNFTGWSTDSGSSVTLFQNYNQRLFKARHDVTSNTAGQTDVEIFPRLKGEQMISGDAVTLSNCKGIFRLTDNRRSWDVDEALIYGIQFKAIEAF
jgi:hypothetical protein